MKGWTVQVVPGPQLLPRRLPLAVHLVQHPRLR